MFRFAGVDLSDPYPTEVGAWIEANVRPAEIFPLAYRTWPDTLTGPILNLTPEAPRPLRLSSYWWPYGASRFGRAHFVITDDQLKRIRVQVQTAGGNSLQKGTLSMRDGGNELFASMWMLPAYSLQQVGVGLNIWLLTLVDDRYWWWGVPLQLTVTPGTTKWTDLYSQIGTALGITITVDSIPSAYSTPTSDYGVQYRPLPVILDTVAWSVGQRITVTTFTGAVRAQNANSAVSDQTAFLVRGDIAIAGGQMTLVPG